MTSFYTVRENPQMNKTGMTNQIWRDMVGT